MKGTPIDLLGSYRTEVYWCMGLYITYKMTSNWIGLNEIQFFDNGIQRESNWLTWMAWILFYQMK